MVRQSLRARPLGMGGFPV